MNDHWCAPQGDGPFARVIYDALAATMERAARTHRCEWCGTHGFGTLGPCSPPTKELTGIAALSLETALSVAREWDEQVRRDERADWQESTAILSELMRKQRDDS